MQEFKLSITEQISSTYDNVAAVSQRVKPGYGTLTFLITVPATPHFLLFFPSLFPLAPPPSSFFRNIYLLIWKLELERKRGWNTQRFLPSTALVSKWLELGQSGTAGIQSGAHMGYRCCRQQLYIWRHNTAGSTFGIHTLWSTSLWFLTRWNVI